MPIAPVTRGRRAPDAALRGPRLFLVLVALASLSWGSAAWVAAPTPPATGAEAGHRVSSPAGEGAPQAVTTGGRTSLAMALRTVGDAGHGVATSSALLRWAGITIVLAAGVVAGHALRRWRALLLGAPPVLDAHLR